MTATGATCLIFVFLLHLTFGQSDIRCSTAEITANQATGAQVVAFGTACASTLARYGQVACKMPLGCGSFVASYDVLPFKTCPFDGITQVQLSIEAYTVTCGVFGPTALQEAKEDIVSASRNESSNATTSSSSDNIVHSGASTYVVPSILLHLILYTIYII